MNGIGSMQIVIVAALVAAWAVFAWHSLHSYNLRENPQNKNTDKNSAPPLLIAYASQTGFAERLAKQSFDMLDEAGMPVKLLSLNRLSVEMLEKSARILFVVSTTGEGDPPDSAIAFARRILSKSASLGSLRFGVLALGDRDYVEFCGFGRRLDEWLRHNGASPLFDSVEVDDGDAGALRHWQHHLSLLSGRHDLPDWSPPPYGKWTLAARRQLNIGSAGGAVFHIELVPEENEDSVWQAGDIAEIGPGHSALAVNQFLDACKLDGEQKTGPDSESKTLSHLLARSVFPAGEDIAGLSVEQLVARLVPLPHREYSIASIPEDGAVHLLIRQMHRPDGSLGLGAGWLTEYAAIGARIDLRLRRNSGFHAPDDHTPLILIGNGTGIAGLRALLKERVGKPMTRNWLVFGERNAAMDFHYGGELQTWHAQGRLERLDLAFSRDQSEPVYVQQRLRERADAIREWVAAGAAIYVCGSLKGMAPAVNSALADILGTEALETLSAQGRYRRDVY